MKLDGRFPVGRGVKQGSVLSPALFRLVMDPLLRQLQASGLGLTINKYYTGGYMHADDIRTLATSKETLMRQDYFGENLCGREPSQTEHQQVQDCGLLQRSELYPTIM